MKKPQVILFELPKGGRMIVFSSIQSLFDTSVAMHIRTSVFGAFLALALSSCGPSMSNEMYPEWILPDLLWSIAEPVPSDINDFRAALIEYGSDIQAEQDFSEFDQLFLSPAVDIQYSYGVQTPSGEWEDVKEVVRVQSDRLLSHGELVLRLHEAAHRHLVDQDHHYFEGLELMPESFENGVPAYELSTGS